LTHTDVEQLRQWLDIGIKAVIGLIISLVGWDYKNVKTTLIELQQSKYELTTQIRITQSELTHLRKTLERIESKLDQLKK
jgi:predicted nuclease with TOPRIM domain